MPDQALPQSPSDCIFCEIAEGRVPVDRLYEDDLILAFPDINPQAPEHLLLIPKQHLASTREALAEHTPMLGRLIAAAAKIAVQKKLHNGYRLVINTGFDGGQTVHHLHLHLLGGRPMTWPPG